MPSVAIIGSTSLYENEFNYLVKVAEAFARRGWVIRTGCAHGADYASMVGARNIDPALLEVYLPWASYNKEYQRATDTTFIYDEGVHTDWRESVTKYHPAPNNLKQSGFKFMARNYGIVMHQRPADIVVAFPDSLQNLGGTGQGVRIAQSLGIPLYIVRRKEDRVALKEFIEAMPIPTL